MWYSQVHHAYSKTTCTIHLPLLGMPVRRLNLSAPISLRLKFSMLEPNQPQRLESPSRILISRSRLTSNHLCRRGVVQAQQAPPSSVGSA